MKRGAVAGAAFLLAHSLFAADRPDEAVRRLLTEWGPAFHRGDVAPVEAQFHFRAVALDSLGVRLQGRSLIGSFLRKDLHTFFPGARHRFHLRSLRRLRDDLVLVDVSHRVSSSERGAASSEFTGLLRYRDGRWWWMAAWPLLPVPPAYAKRKQAPFAGDLDGTEWRIGSSTAPADVLIFERGLFVSVNGFGDSDVFPPERYAISGGDSLVWQSTQTGSSGVRRYWTGEVIAGEMRGERRETISDEDPSIPMRTVEWSARRVRDRNSLTEQSSEGRPDPPSSPDRNSGK